MNKLTTALILILIYSTAGIAQRKNVIETPTHGVKLGVTGLFYNNIQLTYEYLLSDKSGINVTGAFFIPRKAPFNITERMSKEESILINKDRFTGYSFGLDYRFYLGKKGAGRGFYFGPFMRYYRYHITIDAQNISSNNSYQGTIGLGSLSGGAQFGAQWLIKDRYSIDWGFAGVGVSGMSVFGKFESDGGILSQEDRETIAEGLRESGFGFMEEAADKVLSQDGDVNFSYPFWGFAWRSFIRVGYYF